ncbi:MAG: lactate utilization protein [Proteobacteria bacterium]|nr:lactate utilization protein [Pseudomonadota bacterium]
MDKHQVDYRAKLARDVIKSLKSRRFGASYAATKAAAKAQILAMIPTGAQVTRCGSMSMEELGVWDEITKGDQYEIIDPYKPGISKEANLTLRATTLNADIMLASSNAVTRDGILVNLDGLGNRVAALAWGPKKVILAVGMNKVTPDLESAKKRVKEVAAPINAIRLGRKTPCAKTGICADCNSPERICRIWSIIESHAVQDRIHVVLVGEDLGY